jgi:hypothetical protein
MIRNGRVVYDSDGQIVCSAIVPSNFRKTITGIQPPSLQKKVDGPRLELAWPDADRKI